MPIKILSDKIVSKIAAGEVIERPFSVVKELIENSIDANTTRIIIDIKEGGKRQITISDNGLGMNREDALLAFEKHSTSKIFDENDLDNIRTLGFRGEALASISAVSKVTMITKDAESLVGTNIVIEGGNRKEVKDIGSAVGTTITVSDLFYNLPARRKFLKSSRSEFLQILNLVNIISLANPEIQVILKHNNEEIINVPSVDSILDNILYVFGKDVAKEMVCLDFSSNQINITGYITKPSISRSNKKNLIFFVNGRYVKNSLLNEALLEGYGTLLFRGRFPFAVIYINLLPANIDVNVHPTKTEIKFYDESLIISSIRNAVRISLETQRIVFKDEPKSIIPKKSQIKYEPVEQIKFDVIKEEVVEKELEIEDFFEKKRIPSIKIIGQVQDTYIVGDSADGILLIDQHALHERVRYEKIVKKIKTQDKQELIESISIELSSIEMQVIEKFSSVINEVGFVVEKFGHNMILIRGVPQFVRNKDVHEIFIDIVNELVDSQKIKNMDKIKDSIVKLIACRGAIKANEKLSVSELQSMLIDLIACENPFTCPHGRPTIITITKGEIERLFKRKG